MRGCPRALSDLCESGRAELGFFVGISVKTVAFSYKLAILRYTMGATRTRLPLASV